MTLIQKYLFRQISLPVLAACASLAGIGILSQTLDQLEIIVERGQSVWVLLKLTLLAVPQLFSVILPIGLFVGALIALTRLQREQELTAAYASGMSRWQMIAPGAWLAVCVAVVMLLTNVVIQPWSQRTAREQAFSIRTDLAALLVEEGRFVQGPNGLTVYVQQIEQNGLLKNLFIYIQNGDEVTTWDASEARFGRVDGQPVLTMKQGSWQQYSSAGVLQQLVFDGYVFPLGQYVTDDQKIRYKPADLWMGQLFNPTDALVRDTGSRGELLAEAHSRLSSPLYALTAMAMALTAILGGAFSRTGYSARIAKASGAFLLVRVVGYAVVAASAWNGWLNVFQYVLPIVATAVALRLLFRALKPRKASRLSLTRLKVRPA
ncbi:LptF/LptG family permease [Brevundimonas subvibrioides]|uniref:Permease YjgP/YjgQ family protein n=1 Tax=Brevundimonas subvibrioides (strain ATCC 15264 / DSM 4735 / LMG 14903 / NBRC 16000 / CB 81) TaxID=633149 RepID=D9QLJ3_BRESC|nr:LptF/LptG family permease [Brevundimonas subvibrioides]ADL01887.1 permease YjgP/YjgQ family protein [Brevundimonas subvibrioides ATCC 15264]